MHGLKVDLGKENQDDALIIHIKKTSEGIVELMKDKRGGSKKDVKIKPDNKDDITQLFDQKLLPPAFRDSKKKEQA